MQRTLPLMAPGRSSDKAMRLNVLVFPGGTEIGLEIQRALSPCKEVQLTSAGLDIPNHAPYVFRRHFTLPSVHAPGWIEHLNALVAEQHIDYIFPAHDDVLLALAENAERIQARTVSSPLRTCQVTRSKSQTYRLFAGRLPVPKLYEDAAAVERFPVFVKPDRGQGSQGAQAVYSAAELAAALAREALGRNIILEYLPGAEYTVDCFSDREAGLQFCGARERVRTRSGLAMTTRPAHDPLFAEYARTIAGALTFHGAWFFQVKRDAQGAYTLMEIAPRIAGTMALHRVLGVNFPLLSLYEQERIPVQIRAHALEVELDRAIVNRYRHALHYRVVYVDLDDTLILNGAVNVQVVRFLYQCLNAGLRLVLLTKHAGEVQQTLRRYRLSELFDEVRHVAREAHKADYIRAGDAERADGAAGDLAQDAIFIDDSFAERRAVSERHGMLTFDASMLEMLVDERA